MSSPSPAPAEEASPLPSPSGATPAALAANHPHSLLGSLLPSDLSFPQADPANPALPPISAVAAQGQPAPAVNEVIGIMLNVLTSSGKSIKVETTSSDCVLDIRQFLSDMPETCYLTCYHLACKGTKLNDFAELGEYPMFQEAPSAVHTLDMEDDFYDERAARLHVRRLREVLVDPPTHLVPPSPDAYHAIGSAAHVSLSADESKERAKKNADAAIAAFGTDDRSSVDEFSLSSFHQAAAKEKVPECVKNITFSPWNPPPGNRRLRGDLLYLEILTLENHTLHITACVDGFFVNNSSRESFDPSPSAPSYKAHTLVDLLRRASPLFGSRFQQLLSRKSVRHPFESVPVPSPVSDWLAPSSAAHTLDWNRAEDALLSTFGMDARGVLRDWNEEYQSCRDLPAASGPDRVIRERTIYRVYADFVAAAVKGAQAIVHGNIPPINPGEPERTHVYLYNNIFFSYAIDGRGLYKDMGISGDMVAYSVANHDLMGVTAYSEIDLPKLHVLAHCVVNYRGHRVVCQSVIAGIFHDQTSEHLYGSMDNGRTLKCDPTFHSLMLEAGQKLHIAEHPVFDDSGNKALICSAYESKGMSGSDRRKYILDVTRAFPRDANFPNPKQHPTALIRPELLRQYCRSKAFTKALEKQKATAGEEKKAVPSTVYDHAAYLEQLSQLRFNPDAFTVNHTLKRKPLVGVDSKEVPPSDRELDDAYYSTPEGQAEKARFEREELDVKDIANYINSNVLPSLVNDFNQAMEMPLDSVSLTKMLHDRGINMRYLGRLNAYCVKYSISSLEELCTEEMIVRAAKHLLHEHMRMVKPAANQRDEHSFLAPAVAAFLNSLLGRNSCGMGLSEEELGAAKKVMAAEKQRKKEDEDSTEREVGGRLTKKLAARKKKEKAAVIRLSDNSKAPVDPVAPANLWTRIRELVVLKYEHELPNAVELNGRRKLRMLRSLCLKVGIQLACREYKLEEGPSKEREKDPIFTADDILDLFPVVKTNTPRSKDACDLVESGKASLSQGNLQLAYHYLTEALNLFHQIVGPMHKDSADTCSTLAMVCYHAHDFAQAVEYQQKALLINERVLGMDHPETAYAHSTMALLLHSAGFTDAALKHIKRALFLFELICGPNHPDTAATHMNLAMLLQDSGRIYLGLAHLNEALKRFTASLGEHPHTAAAHHALAIGCSLLGRYDDAVNHEKKAKTIYSAKFGDAHVKVQESKAWYTQFTACAVQTRQGKPAVPNFQGLSAPFSWMSLRSTVPFRGRMTMGDILQLVETAARAADDNEKALQQQQELEQQQERLLSSLGMTREEMEAAMALGPRPPKPKKAPALPTVQPVQVAADANGVKGADGKSKNKKRRDKKKADKKPAASGSAATPAPAPAAEAQ